MAILEIIFECFVPESIVSGLRNLTARFQAAMEEDNVVAGQKRPGTVEQHGRGPLGTSENCPRSLEPQQKLRNTAGQVETGIVDDNHTCLSQGLGSMAIEQSWAASQDSIPATEDHTPELEPSQTADIPLTAKRKRGRPPGLVSCKKASKEEKATELLKFKLCSGPPFRPISAAGLIIHMSNKHPGVKLTADTVKQLSQLHRAACTVCGSIRKASTPMCHRSGILTRTRKITISDAIPDYRDVRENGGAPQAWEAASWRKDRRKQ